MRASLSRAVLAALVLSFHLVALGPAAGQPPTPDVSALVDTLFAPLAGKELPGAAVVVLRDGKVLHSRAYGLANIELGVPNTTRTKFRLASVTKPFTALAVLRLMEQGRLGLDDTLATYVPDFVGGDTITIRHLLTHTAGLPDFMSFDEAKTLKREHAPGERLNYSNIGYMALGRVIEKVTGKVWEAHVREAILGPLGMNDTGMDSRRALERGRASGYTFGPEGRFENADYADLSRDPAAGGLTSTAEDMTLWMKALLDGRIVSPAAFRAAATPVTLAGGRQGAYGFGFALIPFRGLREIAHGGDIDGFNAYVSIYPDERLAIIVLSNAGLRPPGPVPAAESVAHQIAGALLGDRLGPEWPEAVAVPPSTLDRYAGRYRLEAPPMVTAVLGDTVEILREGERLFIEAKQGRSEIFPESGTVFYSKMGPVKIIFEPAPDGNAPEAVLSLMGLREFRLLRLSR